jgi:hypothetical protein
LTQRNEESAQNHGRSSVLDSRWPVVAKRHGRSTALTLRKELEQVVIF